MSSTIGLLLALASATPASKDYFATEPMLAGSKIHYCRLKAPKACKTIDRRKEPITTDLAELSSTLTLNLYDMAPEFRSISVDFSPSFDLQINISHDPAKQPTKK